MHSHVCQSLAPLFLHPPQWAQRHTLHCTAAVRHCTVLQLHCLVPHFTALYCTVLHPQGALDLGRVGLPPSLVREAAAAGLVAAAAKARSLADAEEREMMALVRLLYFRCVEFQVEVLRCPSLVFLSDR